MRGYAWGVQEWSGLVLSGKYGSGGGSECHMTHSKGSLVYSVISPLPSTMEHCPASHQFCPEMALHYLVLYRVSFLLYSTM